MSLDLGYGDQFERWEAERADEHSEKALELLHANAIRFCPTCDTEVLTTRRGACLWCDGETTLYASRPTSRPSRIPLAGPAPDPSNGAGPSGNNRKEAA